MALSSVTGRFRQRKISVKEGLQVMRQKDLPELDTEEQQRELQHIETGVEKGEEEERDLQAVMHATHARFHGSNATQVSIPTPDASKTWAEASKYYGQPYEFPEDYLKFSSTVEDTSGCQYNMDEKDDEFLTKYNSDKKGEKQCTEDEFEVIMFNFERVVDKRQPFLSMDPNQVLKFEEIKEVAVVPDEEDPTYMHRQLGNQLGIENFQTLLDAKFPNAPRRLSVLLDMFGADVYVHWRKRRLDRGGKGVFPQLKFEDPTQQQRDDNDPYVCFRRRDYRHARKTRRADMQGVEKLRILARDLRAARQLLLEVAQREVKKQAEMGAELDLFKQRCAFKEAKRALGIKDDDQLLIDPRRRSLNIAKLQRVHDAAVAAAEREERDGYRARQRAEKRYRQRQLDGIDDGPNSLTSQLRRQQERRGSGFVGDGVAPAAVQPYVKLPSAKIPDLEMTTVDAILEEKLNGIQKAVSEKLIKRKLQDEGFVNFTDDPYNPYFNIAPTGEDSLRERSHIPFSSLASSTYTVEDSRQIDFSHVFTNSKHYNNNDSEIVKINAATGQVVRNDRHNYMPVFYDMAGKDGDDVQDHALNAESAEQSFYDKNRLNVSKVLFKLRKRTGRDGRQYIDRKRIVDSQDYQAYLDEIVDDDEPDVEAEADATAKAAAEEEVEESAPKSKKRRSVYDSQESAKRRLTSRFLFDSGMPPLEPVDPSKLNQINPQTQEIRFGCMLLSKAYEGMHQVRQRQMEMYQKRFLYQQRRLNERRLQIQQQQQQQQQRRQQLQQQANGSVKRSQTPDRDAAGKPTNRIAMNKQVQARG